MKINRKLKRAREVARKKKNKKTLKEVGKFIQSMDKTCHSCGAVLDETNRGELDKWRIQVFETGRTRFTCGACYENIAMSKEAPAE